MKQIYTVFLRALPLLLVAIAAYYFADRFWDPRNAHSPEEATRSIQTLGKPAIDFTLPLAAEAGKKFSLKELKGKAVIVNFWATWCAPCVQEMPSLLETAKRFQGKDLKVVAISVDKDRATLDRFFARNPKLAAMKTDFILLLDDKSEVSTLYGVDKYPESFLISRGFQIEMKLSGSQAWVDPQYDVYYDKILLNK